MDIYYYTIRCNYITALLVITIMIDIYSTRWCLGFQYHIFYFQELLVWVPTVLFQIRFVKFNFTVVRSKILLHIVILFSTLERFIVNMFIDFIRIVNKVSQAYRTGLAGVRSASVLDYVTKLEIWYLCQLHAQDVTRNFWLKFELPVAISVLPTYYLSTLILKTLAVLLNHITLNPCCNHFHVHVVSSAMPY